VTYPDGSSFSGYSGNAVWYGPGGNYTITMDSGSVVGSYYLNACQ
jgi:hypothetical protein